MTPMRSLRSRVIAGMVPAQRARLRDLVPRRQLHPLAGPLGGRRARRCSSRARTSATGSSPRSPSKIRSAEQYLVRPSEACGCSARGGRLGVRRSSAAIAPSRSLTTSDRYIVNKIADNQAQIEVAYAIAHALDRSRPGRRGAPAWPIGRGRRPTRCWATFARCRWRRPTARWRAPPTCSDSRSSGGRRSGSSSSCRSSSRCGSRS